MEMQGSIPVYISFNSDTDEENARLQSVLEQIDGFLFTGGNLTLINRETGDTHPYYRTAKKVVDFAIKSKDERGIDFPILAVCQGFQVLGMYVNKDSKDILKDVECIYKSKQVDW